MTSVEMTNEEAWAFRKFREHQQNFEFLLEAKVFEVKNGTASLTFNKDGILVSVTVDTELWRRKKKKL